MKKTFDVVTGAFGYSGQYIGRLLLARGRGLRTLSNRPAPRDAYGAAVVAHPLRFDRPDLLEQALRGADTLYNTYWVRFNHRRFNHQEAVSNTRTLFAAARSAGVRRIVHLSITNPSLTSPLPYFRGKAELEQALVDSGVSYSILRPAVIFGPEDILINNIAWVLRRFPLFGLFGDGSYRLQPIHVGDLAELAVSQGMLEHSTVVEAIGPETYTYRELVRMIRDAIGVRRPIISLPPSWGWLVGWLVGKVMKDVTITRAEISGLMQGLLHVHASPAGQTRLSTWALENAAILGRRYAHELGRRR